MSAPQLPAGFHLVPLDKGCVLILTTHEFRLGLKRGRWWRRATATARREAKDLNTRPGACENALPQATD